MQLFCRENEAFSKDSELTVLSISSLRPINRSHYKTANFVLLFYSVSGQLSKLTRYRKTESRIDTLPNGHDLRNFGATKSAQDISSQHNRRRLKSAQK